MFFPSSYSFPPVPNDTSTFVSQNLTTQPTFFGCNLNKDDAPLVIYIANGGPPQGQPALTNQTSFFFNYTDDLLQSMLQQSFTLATQGRPKRSSNSLTDPAWPACLACAVADRARGRSGTKRAGVCVDCFERYCWTGDSVGAGSGAKSSSGHGGKVVNGFLETVMLALLALFVLVA
jgi:lysophospholipase